MTTAAKIIKSIGCKYLRLYKGTDYWYFIYDDIANGRYDSYSVYTMRLNDLPQSKWIDEGKDFVKKMEEIA